MNDISIYVHIPFCESKCYYCDFNSGLYSKEIQEKYFSALKNEIIQNKIKNKIKSIYFGGGTPSAVEPDFIVEILNLIKNNFNVKKDAEITIECNPNSLDGNKLKTYYNAGFNRLSLGVQTTNKKSLKIIGRITEKNKLKNYKKIIKNNLKIAKKIGFKNLSTDLMLGLPKNNIFNLIKDFLFLKKYSKHISVYMLTVYENTKFFEISKKYNLERKIIREYKLTEKFLKLFGYKQYEISNFAKAGFESKHNLNYWNLGEYLGFGLSAHSHIGDFRYSNSQSINTYLQNFENLKFNTNLKLSQQIIEQVKLLNNNIEQLSVNQQAEEYLMLQFRLNSGLDLNEFKAKFYDLSDKKRANLKELEVKKLIKTQNGKLFLTQKGRIFENQVILQLI